MPHHRTWPLIVVLAAGCNRQPAPDYPNLVKPSHGPKVEGSYALLLEAGLDASRAAGDNDARVKFTPRMRTDLVKKLSPQIEKVRAALRGTIEFDQTGIAPFETRYGSSGWRLIGLALQWRIEDKVKAANRSGAAADLLLATKLGLTLTTQDAESVSLGCAIVENAQKAYEPALALTDGASLKTLAKGLSGALESHTDISTAIQTEGNDLLTAIQWLQDRVRANEWEKIEKSLGRDAQPAVDYLRNLADSDRPDYFRNFAEEAEEWALQSAKQSALPVNKRKPYILGEDTKRPWRRFARHFGSNISVAQAIFDVTIARTRLLAVEVHVYSEIRETRAAPKDLVALPASVSVDPFTGNRLVYSASAQDFKLYSVGQDMMDNGGVTDATGTVPDIVLHN